MESSKEMKPVAIDTTLTLDDLDNHTGILHVWYLMLEGLSGAIAACPKSYQPQTMEMMFELLRSASQVPGMFGLAYKILVLIGYALSHSSNVCEQLSSEATELPIRCSLCLCSYFVCANNEGYCETAHQCMLVLDFPASICDKYQNLMNWPKNLYSSLIDNRISIHLVYSN